MTDAELGPLKAIPVLAGISFAAATGYALIVGRDGDGIELTLTQDEAWHMLAKLKVPVTGEPMELEP